MQKITMVFIGILLLTSQQVYAKKGVMGDLIGYAIGKAMGKAVGEHISSNDTQLDESTLKKVAESVNERLPIELDTDTRLDSTMAGPGRKFTYFYTFTRYSSAEIDPVMLRDIEPTIIQRACTSLDLRVLYQNEVIVIFSYQGNDGQYISKIEMTPEACNSNKVLKKISPSNDLQTDIRTNLKKYVGSKADEIEIERCTQKVEKIISGLLKNEDYRKIAIATKVKMAVNTSKQNIVSMITNSYPGIVTNEMAANIFDALNVP